MISLIKNILKIFFYTIIFESIIWTGSLGRNSEDYDPHSIYLLELKNYNFEFLRDEKKTNVKSIDFFHLPDNKNYYGDSLIIVRGVILNLMKQPIPGANIFITTFGMGTSADESGSFLIIIPIEEEIEFKISAIGYKTKILKKRKEELNNKIAIILEEEVYLLGGIVVKEKRENLPDKSFSSVKITSDEIENFQALSLKDILDLDPTVVKIENPSLSKSSFAAIRNDFSDPISSFGTTIIIDGVRFSNNYNLQYEKLSGAKYGFSDMGRGFDLRKIAADNIEEVEIIKGAASAKYKEYAGGIIEVKTKTNKQPFRLKAKKNSDVLEMNFCGSFGETFSVWPFNVNFARSERDRRLIGDEYSRVSLQIANRYSMSSSSYMLTKAFLNFIFDEEEPRYDFSKTKNYNRGFLISASNSGKINDYDNYIFIDYNFNINFTKENSLKSKLVDSDLRILPNGDTIGAYIGKVRTLGEIWQADINFDFKKRIITNKYIATDYSIGFNLSYENNFGKGLQVDSIFNYYGPDSPIRTRKFSSLPGQIMTGSYIEFQNNFVNPFKAILTLGVRADQYFSTNQKLINNKKIDPVRGNFFNPRLGSIIFLSKSFQLRANYGISSKSPAASYIYPKESVFKWRNPLDSSIKYFKFYPKNEKLKGYQEESYEFFFDAKIMNNYLFTISYYAVNSLKFPSQESEPYFYYHYYFNKWRVFYISQYSIYKNIGKRFNRGAEASLRGDLFQNLKLSIFATYNFSKTPSFGKSFTINNDESIGQKSNYKSPNAPIDTILGFIYPKEGIKKDHFKFNYHAKYFSKEIGLWISLIVEHMIFERSQRFNLIPVDYSLLNESQKRNRLFEEAKKIKGSKFLMNVYVTKKIFEGAEISFFANNFLDDPAIRQYYSTPEVKTEEKRNPALFFGIEFSWTASQKEK